VRLLKKKSNLPILSIAKINQNHHGSTIIQNIPQDNPDFDEDNVVISGANRTPSPSMYDNDEDNDENKYINF